MTTMTTMTMTIVEKSTTIVEKPSFAIPSMNEIATIPYNGYTVASTFSGAGGSSLGYRLAGFRVLWANEFISAARETYRANFPSTIIDPRDIRTVKGADILSCLNLDIGELDILDGSPPCAAFSTAGRREAVWRQERDYSGVRQRVDDLFDEFIRLVREVRPRVFVAENVKGLVVGTAKGYFKRILSSLRASGYIVNARILDAQWLGVPQHRERLIFVGVRDDLRLSPVFPQPLPYRYTVRDVCPWIVRIRDSQARWHDADIPAYTIVQSDVMRVPSSLLSSGGWVEVDIDRSPYIVDKTHDTSHFGEKFQIFIVRSSIIRRKFLIEELRRIFSFPDDFILTGSYAQQWERLGRSVPPMMMYHIASTIRRDILDKLPKRG